MSFSAWDRGRGDRQLRVVQPEGFNQPGLASFVLGSDIEGVMERLAINDFVHVYQDMNLTGMTFLRATFSLRGPVAAIPGAIWRCKWLVDFIEAASTDLPIGRTRNMTNFGINVSKLSGFHNVGVQLKLEAP